MPVKRRMEKKRNMKIKGDENRRKKHRCKYLAL
jgi:hypothetical protein